MGNGWGRMAMVAVALLMCVPAQAAEKRAFEKTMTVADPDTLSWPLPWKPDMVLTYDQHYVSEETQGSETVRITGTDVVDLRMAPRAGGGWIQTWTGRDPKMRTHGMPPQIQTIATAAVESFRDVSIDIALNPEGHFENVANLPDVQPRYRRALQDMFEAMLVDLKGTPGADDTEVMFARMVDAISAPAVLESQLGETPAAYNFVSGGGLALDHEYDYDDEYANPLDGEMIASANSLRLTRPADDAKLLELRWTIRPDVDALTGVIARFVDRTVGDKGSDAKGREATIAKLLADAEFLTEVTYRVDPASGIVQRMEMVQRKHFGGKRETESTTLQLRR